MSAEIFRFELEGGHMRYHHRRDIWVVWKDRDGRLDDIDANHFKTIREFKQWAQERINASTT